MQSFFEYLVIVFLSYVFGSFPSAYLLLKATQNKDIRKEGSGIVGTMNALEVSQSVFVGLSVLLLDIIKSIVCILICVYFFGSNFFVIFLSGIFLIIGHLFPLWLKFKGGRGLAVTAGIMLMTAWIFIIVWVLFFSAVYLIRKNIHISNIIATILTPIFLFFVPDSILNLNIFSFNDKNQLLLFSVPVCFLLLLSHRDQIQLILKGKKLNE